MREFARYCLDVICEYPRLAKKVDTIFEGYKYSSGVGEAKKEINKLIDEYNKKG